MKTNGISVKSMKVNDWVHVIAGTFVFISSMLGYFTTKYWLFFTMFVGLNLFQYGFTRFCHLAIALKKAGVKE